MAGEGAVALNFLAGLGKALAAGLSAAKPVEQGCGSCPKKKRTFKAPPKRRSR